MGKLMIIAGIIFAIWLFGSVGPEKMQTTTVNGHNAISFDYGQSYELLD